MPIRIALIGSEFESDIIPIDIIIYFWTFRIDKTRQNVFIFSNFYVIV